MSERGLPPQLGALTMFIDDVERSKVFYRNLFATDPLFGDETSVAFRFGDTILNLVLRSGASELIDPRPLADVDAGSEVMLTTWVPDADAACALLAEQGIAILGGPMDRPWGVRTATFQDPDGHVWEVAQQLG